MENWASNFSFKIPAIHQDKDLLENKRNTYQPMNGGLSQ